MLINSSNQAVLATDLEWADSFWRRLCGLLGRSGLEPGRALVLKPCNSVHTWFMRFNLDILFLDSHLQVLHLEQNLIPFRFSKIIKGAVLVVELPPGTILSTGTKNGDYLRID